MELLIDGEKSSAPFYEANWSPTFKGLQLLFLFTRNIINRLFHEYPVNDQM